MKNTTTTATKANLEKLIATANKTDEANFAVNPIPSAIVTELETINKAMFTDACKALASKSKKEFFKAFFTVKVASGLAEKDTADAIKNAVSAKQFTLSVNDGGLIELVDSLKPISFNDVLAAKIKLLAFAHADQTATKADRVTAIKFYFGDYGKGYLDILTHNARQFASIGNCDSENTAETITLNANGKKSLEMLEAKYAKAKKDNPFVAKSNNALTAQIMDSVEYFINSTDTKLFSYHCKGLFQMICYRNKYGKLFIAKDTEAFNSLAIVYRYAFNGYKLPTADKTDIYKTIK